MIQVVLASNSSYFYGLLVTVASLLESNKTNTFTLHIIDGGLSPRQKRILSRRTVRRNPDNKILYHQIDGQVFRGFKADYGNSYMTYARILVAALVPSERVIYLDTDLLVAADIRPLWDIDLGENIVAAAPDRDIPFVKDDYPLDGPCSDARYFNAGVMLINLDLWRKLNVQDKLLRMITAQPDKFRWWDQTAMNAIFQGQVRFIDPSWNTFADSVTFSISDGGRIFHYVGGTKPWGRYLDTPEFKLWRAFFSRYAMSGLWLIVNPKLAPSFLQFLRHRMICKLPFLKSVTASLLAMRERLAGRNAAEAAQRFRDRHTASPSSSQDALWSTSQMESYIAARWG